MAMTIAPSIVDNTFLQTLAEQIVPKKQYDSMGDNRRQSYLAEMQAEVKDAYKWGEDANARLQDKIKELLQRENNQGMVRVAFDPNLYFTLNMGVDELHDLWVAKFGTTWIHPNTYQNNIAEEHEAWEHGFQRLRNHERFEEYKGFLRIKERK